MNSIAHVTGSLVFTVIALCILPDLSILIRMIKRSKARAYVDLRSGNKVNGQSCTEDENIFGG
jgi:hypothetical protein